MSHVVQMRLYGILVNRIAKVLNGSLHPFEDACETPTAILSNSRLVALKLIYHSLRHEQRDRVCFNQSFEDGNQRM